MDSAGRRNGGFVLCRAFLDEFWPVGGLMSHSQIATGGSNLIGPPHQFIQTYHNQPWGGWGLAESAGGWKSGSILWPAKFDKNSTFLGGGLAIAKLHSAGRIGSVRLVEIFKHTTISHWVAGFWPNWPGDGKGAPFCCRDNSKKI